MLRDLIFNSLFLIIFGIITLLLMFGNFNIYIIYFGTGVLIGMILGFVIKHLTRNMSIKTSTQKNPS